ncbi:endolytic transglycosylase MltG [Patescibacteria group bacterium]|nr:endolytic transglycosylase MltG [Patescibacteria group bacterium]
MLPAPAFPNYTENGSPTSPLRRFLRRAFYAGIVLAAITGIALSYVQHIVTPPNNFPVEQEFVITEGATTVEITEALYAAGFVRSPFALYAILVMLHDPRELKASTYIFSQPLSAFELAERFLLGDYGNDLVRFVHYEGESRKFLAERAGQVLRGFDAEAFLALTEGKEGKLFPDTYLLPKVFSAPELAALLEETYESRVGPLRPAMFDSSLTEEEIIILASILEREANTPQSKGMVADILLRRLEMGMPLQVDASMEYVLDKPLNELLASDLDVDSPYNTYLNDGLPPTPIGNPGLTAIQAVLEPTPSNYLFYITGNDGVFYYAETYAQHKRNIDAYLR